MSSSSLHREWLGDMPILLTPPLPFGATSPNDGAPPPPRLLISGSAPELLLFSMTFSCFAMQFQTLHCTQSLINSWHVCIYDMYTSRIRKREKRSVYYGSIATLWTDRLRMVTDTKAITNSMETTRQNLVEVIRFSYIKRTDTDKRIEIHGIYA